MLAWIYAYDSFGNIKQLSYNGILYNFTYDAQNRLTCSHDTLLANGTCNNGSNDGQAYGYDAAGRILQYEATYNNESFNSTFPAHATKISGYAYDANGNTIRRFNVLNGQWQRLTWDAENRLSSVVNDANTQTIESYLYGADGRRLKKLTGSTATYYVNPFYEVSGGVITKYYFFNGQRIALRKNNVLYYLHGDHLGSVALFTNQLGQVEATQGYNAYGRQAWGANPFPAAYRYTGQPEDDATGLYYYGARYYDLQLGQFISPDTLVPDATNLMDYDRYAYARGNPMKYNDPTEHCETAAPEASDHAAYKEWATCWQYATTILAQWDNTPGYWNDRFTSKDVYMKYVASNGSNHAAFFQDTFHQYLKSDEYQAWAVKQPIQPTSKAALADPMCAGEKACQALLRTTDQVQRNVVDPTMKYCTQKDCVTQSLDVIGTGAAIGAAVCAGFIVTAGPCSLPLAAISVAISGSGAAWTARQVLKGNGDELDLATARATLMIGINSTPGVGAVASAYQTDWDFFRSYPNNHQ
ncbi:MAG: RHS repeat-associated core domain-containing protein [Caldilineaceae bacterium]